MYRYTYTWSDGVTFTTVAEDTWTAQNRAHWDRYGQFGTPDSERTAELVNVVWDKVEENVDDGELSPAEAEYTILRLYDDRRMVAGHDYGSGQRARELSRRRRELDDVQVRRVAFTSKTALLRWHQPELVAAFERVGRPRVDRVKAEEYRHNTPATTRTISAWRRVACDLGIFDV